MYTALAILCTFRTEKPQYVYKTSKLPDPREEETDEEITDTNVNKRITLVIRQKKTTAKRNTAFSRIDREQSDPSFSSVSPALQLRVLNNFLHGRCLLHSKLSGPGRRPLSRTRQQSISQTPALSSLPCPPGSPSLCPYKKTLPVCMETHPASGKPKSKARMSIDVRRTLVKTLDKETIILSRPPLSVFKEGPRHLRRAKREAAPQGSGGEQSNAFRRSFSCPSKPRSEVHLRPCRLRGTAKQRLFS